MNVILVKRRNMIQEEETRHEENLPEKNHEARNDINNTDTDDNGVVGEQSEELTEDDTELEGLAFLIEAMDHCSLLQLEPHEKLPKKKLTK